MLSQSLAFFLCLSLAFFASAGEKPLSREDLRSVLGQYKSVKGNFKQTRFVKELDLKLKSEGNFEFRFPMQLFWNQQKPFELSLTVTADKMIQKNSDGSEQSITREQQPLVFLFTASFLSLFSFDEKAMDKNFSFRLSRAGSQWLLDLTPKDEILKKSILEVKIRGQELVQQIEVLDKSGNSTQIEFSQVKGFH